MVFFHGYVSLPECSRYLYLFPGWMNIQKMPVPAMYPIVIFTAWVGWHNIFLVRQVLAHRRLNFMITPEDWSIWWMARALHAAQSFYFLYNLGTNEHRAYIWNPQFFCMSGSRLRLIKPGVVWLNSMAFPCWWMNQVLRYVRTYRRAGWIRVWSSLVCRWLGELNQESYESVAPSERKTKRHARGKRWGWVEPFEVGGWLEDFYEVNDSPYLKVKYIYVQVPKIYFQVKWAVQLWSVA